MRGWGRRKQLYVAAALTVVLLGIGATWLYWPSTPVESPRERQYRTTTACLLTDDKGLVGGDAKAAWAGMQEASIATLVKAQYLSISGPQTAANGLSYFNSLAVQKCTVIVAVGKAPVAAMLEGQAQFPGVRYVAVGGDTSGSSVAAVDASSPGSIQAGVKAIVSDMPARG